LEKPTNMRKGTCKYYNGDHHNKTCDAGVEYRSVTTDPDNITGKAYRKPCIDWMMLKAGESKLSSAQLECWNRRGTCEKRTEPTDAEIETYEKEMNAHMEKTMVVWATIIPEIKTEFKGQSWKGVRECPICKGRLHLSHAAFNGHVWGKCETEGCVAWVE
jgi:allantoicase